MCGIAGVVGFGGPVAEPASVAETLSDRLAHRGPDGSGSYRSADGCALLVHRRLAIIDPSDRGAQPMSTADGRYHLVYNGEAYNYRALREEYEGRGARFQTQSDTEVVLHGLASEGPASLARVRGMFALALWDARARTLLVARDRFGMKPLYVTAARRGQVAFASEVGALVHAGLATRVVSPAGILAFLSWASIPEPLTWVHGVEQLEAGTWRRWAADGHERGGRFADGRSAYVDSPDGDERALRARVGEAVRDSVRAHLVADVPVGVFLSSGVDSGAILSTARAATGSDLRAYTVVVDEPAYSEEPGARLLADHFGVSHDVLRVDASRVDRDLDEIVSHLDQPTADAVNSYYVSKAVAQTGVKAVLSGVGGDELFGGYPSFRRIPAGLNLSRTLGPLLQATGAAAGLALPGWRAAKWRHFAQDPRPASAYRALRGFFMPEELPALVGPALREPDVWTAANRTLGYAEAGFLAGQGRELPLAAVARMETRGFLASQLLRDIDAVSMAHGLEVRMPFVDHVLQQAVWPALGAHPALAAGKRLLHETLARPLPGSITQQPKQGFTLPFAQWLRGPLGDATRDGLNELSALGWVDREAADQVWRAWERGQAHWSRAWGLGVLGRFLGHDA